MCDIADSLMMSAFGKCDNDRDKYHLGKVLMKTLNKFSTKINQIDGITGESETHESVLNRSIKLACWMKTLGIREGDVVMIASQNCFEVTVALVASLFLGAAILPVDVSFKCEELQYFFDLGKPKLIFCESSEFLGVLEVTMSQTEYDAKVVTFGTEYENRHETFEDIMKSKKTIDNFKPTDFDPASVVAFIYCTSGSTGKPKGVVLTHKALIVRILDFWYDKEHSYEQDILMSASTLHWITGAFTSLTPCLRGCARVFSSKPFSTEIAKNIINTYKPTITLMGPFALKSIMQDEYYRNIDWSPLNTICITGSAFGLELAKEAKAKLPDIDLISLYGMTETTGAIATYTLKPPLTNVPLGCIRPMLKAKVIDADGNQLGPRETGELILKSEYVFAEYYRNAASTKEAFTEDGWFKTGDLVYYDENKMFYYVDRLKLIMKYNNQQISPVELESVILTHSSVSQVAVDKIEDPPNDLPIAFVVKKPNIDTSAQEIRDFVADKLAAHKQLRGGVVFLDSIPITVTGKIDRKAIREKAKTIKAGE